MTTHLDKVMSTSPTFYAESLSPCEHEDAHSRLLQHAKHAAIGSHEKILIRTVYSDVAIITLFPFHQINASEMWIAFGAGKDKHYIPIHQCAKNLGPQNCTDIPFCMYSLDVI